MLLIWQINIVIVLCFLTFFLGLELLFFSSVLGSVAVLFMILYIWNYGSKLKYETEVKHKLSMDLMLDLGCNLGTIRAPGIGLVYNELVRGVPAIFGHFLTTLLTIHSMIIFVCIKYVPVPVVPQTERFLFRRVCPKSYCMFRCIARYGYKDVHKENHQTFEQILIESLEKFIPPNDSVYSLSVPLLAGYGPIEEASSEVSISFDEPHDVALPDAHLGLDRELAFIHKAFIHKAKESGLVISLGTAISGQERNHG
ncbi:hypothetical protein ZIOFF_058789 [Zingiber officinale]|uniref:K+ potassium transporter C-terminal domain-containing protein n=1 Tax=Zingiber officinale TaxID=94328 RepID=A0A8J5F998_ZINOF|nr:hypothetical protein ZIOFF_058789 [Zingiber officinale]